MDKLKKIRGRTGRLLGCGEQYRSSFWSQRTPREGNSKPNSSVWASWMWDACSYSVGILQTPKPYAFGKILLIQLMLLLNINEIAFLKEPKTESLQWSGNRMLPLSIDKQVRIQLLILFSLFCFGCQSYGAWPAIQGRAAQDKMGNQQFSNR